MLGTKFKVIFGYEGGAQMGIAMERGELDGRGVNTWASYKSTMPNAIRDGHLNVLMQIGLRKDPDLPNVPLFLDAVKGDPEKEAVARFITLSLSVNRPIAAPPGVPKDRVEILRHAFDDTMKDPAFLAEAKKLGAEIDPMTGQETQDAVAQVLGTPKAIIARTQAALEGKW